MQMSSQTSFTCPKHPQITFMSQKALDKHLQFAPAHQNDRNRLNSNSNHRYPVGGAVSDDWSTVSKSEEAEVLELLLKECHPVQQLRQHKHLLQTFTEKELETTWLCEMCGGKFFKENLIAQFGWCQT